MPDSYLTPPGGIESAALCFVFAQGSPPPTVCQSGSDAGSNGFFSAGGVKFPVTQVTDAELNVILAALAGSVAPDNAIDVNANGVGPGLTDAAQTAAERLFEVQLATSAKTPNGGVNLLALRAFAFLAAQVVQTVASQQNVSFATALATLTAAGFQPPAGWLSTLVLSHPSFDDVTATSASVSLVTAYYLTALHGLMSQEAAGTLQGTTTIAALPSGSPAAIAPGTPGLGNDSGATQTVTQPNGTYTFQIFGSPAVLPILGATPANVAATLGTAFSSLATAFIATQAPAPSLPLKWQGAGVCTDPKTHYDPATKSCLPNVSAGITPPKPVLTSSGSTSAAGSSTTTTPAPTDTASSFPWGWVVGGVVALGALGAGGYWYYQKHKKDQEKASAQATPPAAAPALPAAGAPARAGNPLRRAKIIANLGDVDFATYGGTIVRENGEAEHFDPNLRIVWSYPVDRLKWHDGALVPYEYADTWPKGSHAVWFDRDLPKIAAMADMSHAELVKMFASEDPVERAAAYDLVGSYKGYDSLDSSPSSPLTKSQISSRYGKVKPRY